MISAGMNLGVCKCGKEGALHPAGLIQGVLGGDHGGIAYDQFLASYSRQVSCSGTFEGGGVSGFLLRRHEG